jgi:hypothetical protein
MTPDTKNSQASPPLSQVTETPTGKLEYTDGTSWYVLATENFVLNSIIMLKPCIAASTENLSVNYDNGTDGVGATMTSISSEAFTLDGVPMSNEFRVLIKDQAFSFQNGIYVVTNVGGPSTSWVLTRDTDYNTPSAMLRGGIVNIIDGDTNLVSSWMQTAVITAIGTADIIFSCVVQSSKNFIFGTDDQIVVTVTNNIATLSFASNPVFPGTGSATLPGGTTDQRPTTLVPGMIRFNNGS